MRRIIYLRSPRRLLVTGLATALLLAVILAPGCGDEGSSAGGTTTDYVGLWVDKAPFGVVDEGGGRWVRIERTDDGYVLTWLVRLGQPSPLPLVRQDDGTLRPTVDVSAQAGPAPVSALALDDQGKLEVRAPEGAWDDDPSDDTPVFVLERGTEEEYAAVREIWAVEDDYDQAMNTLRDAVEAWAMKHDRTAPPVKEVKPGGAIDDQLQSAGKSWPTFGNGTMLLPGKDRGEYVYKADAYGFTLTGLSPAGKPSEIRTSLTVLP